MHIILEQLRKEAKLNQETVADQLGITRQTYSKIEKWETELTLGQAVKLSEMLKIDIESLLSSVSSGHKGDWKKYRQIITNCIRYWSGTNGKITKTKLAKLCYLVDFSWYYFNLESLSGLTYRKLQLWPVPHEYFSAIDELQEAQSIDIEFKSKALLIYNIEEPSRDELSDDEMQLLQKICKKWKNKSTEEIVTFTHQQLPWSLPAEKEVVPYSLITQEEPDNVY